MSLVTIAVSSREHPDADEVIIGADRFLSRADSDYSLYANKRFGRIPEEGDPLGVVGALALLANADDSGITLIAVSSHGLRVLHPKAVDSSHVEEQILRAFYVADVEYSVKVLTT